MAKGRKTAALAALGLGAAALSGMFDKKKDKTETKSADTTADASAGMAKNRLGADGLDMGDKDTTGDMSAGRAKDSLAALEKAKARARKGAERTAKAPIRKAPAASTNPATSAFSVPTEANRTGVNENARDMLLARGAKTPGQRFADRQEAASAKMRGAYRDAFRPTPNERGAELSDVVGAKRGGKVKAKKYASGGSVSSASKRADGCAVKGKTRGKMV